MVMQLASLLIGKRFIQAAAGIAGLFILYTEAATAYLNTQSFIQAKAVADNALLRQNSEALLADQQAKAQLQVARNAAERQKAEAEKAEADALKLEAEAITATEMARNASLKAFADAETIKAEAELRTQKLIVAIETARNAAVRQKAEADKIEAQVIIKREANAVVKREVDITDCSKTYRPRHFVEDFADIMSRNMTCRN